MSCFCQIHKHGVSNEYLFFGEYFKMTKAKTKTVILSENPKNNFEHLKDTDKCCI